MPTTSPIPCSHAVMVQRGTGNPVVLLNTGAYPGFSNFLNQTWTWNGTTWARNGSGTVDSSGPLPLRSNFAMTYDGYNVVMFGGQGESETSGVQQDTWTFNGTTWTKQTPATVPFGRIKAEMATITSGQVKSYLFGGSNVLNYLSETWAWNGSALTWTLLAPTNSPSARVDHMLSSGPSYIVLFGGKGTNSCLNDTWTFNGTNWTQLAPATSPSVRAEACICYDTTNANWVMFGGRNDDNMLLGETWTFNGTTWTKQAPAASPSARVGAQMCYDSQAGAVIMFGGNDQAGNTFSDTWKWSGTAWTQL